MKTKKPWKWWAYLLLIPGGAVVDVLILLAGMLLDIAVMPEGGETLGHASPTFTVIAMLIAAAGGVFIVLFAVIRAIVSAVQAHKAIKAAEVHETDENMVPESRSPKRHPLFLLMIPGRLLLHYLMIYVGVMIDSSLYTPPTEHPGFMFPTVTILILIAMIPGTLASLIVSLVLSFKRR